MLTGACTEGTERAGPARLEILVVPRGEHGDPPRRRRRAHAGDEIRGTERQQRTHARWLRAADPPQILSDRSTPPAGRSIISGRLGSVKRDAGLALSAHGSTTIGPLEQQIRFCTTPDRVRLAYATHGNGPPLVKAANWLTHLEFDWESPVWRHWLEELGRGNTVVRYDERGCGLSDWDVEDLSLEAWISDLETVVDAAGLDRFALLGVSQGGAIAVAYAVRHPERVTQLILHGAYARGRMKRDRSAQAHEEAELMLSLIRVGWGRANPTFRRVFSELLVPGGTPEQLEWFDELARTSTSPEIAERLERAWYQIEVTELLSEVTVPTLVAHGRGDATVPFTEGRLLATGIPGARFVPLDSENHILLAEEPAWPVFLAGVREFLGSELTPDGELPELSPREIDVLELVATGLSNEQIAERLYLSVRTVERHLTNIYAKLRLSGKAARAAAAARFSRSSR
jgi:pimeloyl-ACP methyl ester carboxylesterase/DNA-binding CsgD family transcriptional regulator